MFLMLGVIFLYVALGLLAPRLGVREHIVIVLIAGAMTTAYVVFANKVL